jgi:hypothetical protein
MAKECFCGCGSRAPRFPLFIRSINKRGRQVVARLDRIEELIGRDVDEPQIKQWYADGDEIVGALAEAVHGEIDPRTLDERAVRAWQADGREIERVYRMNMAKLGRAVRESGLSDEEAAEAIARGELNPFTDQR